MDDSCRYYAADFTARAISRTQSLLTSSALERPRVMVHEMVRLLLACRPPRTIEQHVAYLSARTKVPDGTVVAAALRRLIAAGLMVPAAESRPADEAGGRQTISSIAIVAPGSAEALNRCLAFYAGQLRGRRCKTRILVLEGVHHAGISAQKRAIAAQSGFESERPVHYVGADERLQLRARLISSGADPTLVDFAIGPGRTLAWVKNLLLLLTAGERVLMASDSTCAAIHVAPSSTGSLILSAAADPYRYEFFEKRAEVTAHDEPDFDLLAAHEVVLGRSLADLCSRLEGECDSVMASRRLTALMSRGPFGGRVRLTLSGVEGALHQHPFRLMFLGGDAQRQMAASVVMYDRALAFRQARRLVERVVITDSYETAICCGGLDNTDPLPPMAPVTACDESFTFTLPICDRSAVTAHLPHALVDQPSGDLCIADPTVQSAIVSDARQLLKLAVGSCGQPLGMWSSAERLTTLGRHLIALAELGPSDFCDTIREGMLDVRCRELAALDAAASHEDCPPHLAGGFASYRAAFMEILQNDLWFLPGDIGSRAQPSVPLSQRFLRQFGQLLTEWPSLYAAARELRESDALLDTTT